MCEWWGIVPVGMVDAASGIIHSNWFYFFIGAYDFSKTFI